MSFQAYIDNIKAKTGKTPEDFKEAAEKAGIFNYDMKASDLVKFLQDKYDLGHGHCMAIWAYWKMKGWIADPKKKN